MLKLPRTIRLDPSDTFVFERAAEPGEWAVSGAFVFWDSDTATLGQKQRVALRSGFLGIDSLGWSTLAVVTEASEAERQSVIDRLALRPRAPQRKKKSRLRLRCAITSHKRCWRSPGASRMEKSASASGR